MAEQVENTFTQDERDALELEYRRIAIITSESGEYEIIVGPADRIQWRTFRAASGDDNKKDAAQETLVTATICAIAYRGEKTSGRKEARGVLVEKLLKDWAGCCDGTEVFKLLHKVNMGQGERRAKS